MVSGDIEISDPRVGTAQRAVKTVDRGDLFLIDVPDRSSRC